MEPRPYSTTLVRRGAPSLLVILLLLSSVAAVAMTATAEEHRASSTWVVISDGLPTSGTYFGVAFGHVDKDEKLDLVGASDGSGLRVYLGDGTGGWTAVSTHPATDGGFGDVCLGDYDGDGNNDLFAGSPGNSDGNPRGLHVWKGDGRGGFTDVTASSGLPTSGYWRGVAVGDVNNDGKLDLAATNGYGTSEGVHVFKGDGTGKFTDASTGLPGNQDRDSKVVLADLNGDGNLDVVAGGAAGVDVYLGNGGGATGNMVWTQASVGLPDSRYSGISAVDVDEDGSLDLVVSAYGAGSGQGIHAYRNVRNGALWESVSNGLPSSGDYIDNEVADVTGNGHVDIVTAGSYGGTYGVHIYEGDGEGNWNERSPGLPSSDQYVGVSLGDMNGDGALDLAVGKRTRGGGLYVYENPVGSPAPEVTLLTPVGGESWTGASQHRIEWTATSGTPPYTVTITYSTDGGATFPNTVASGIAQASEGTSGHDWTLPNLDVTSVRVQVAVTDSLSETGLAQSPSDLEIDSRPPIVSGSFPSQGATDISTDSPIILTFSEGMEPGSSDAVSITGPGGPTLSSPSWAGAQLTLQTSGLVASSDYTVQVSTAAEDDSAPGNPMTSPHSFTFTTGAGVAPTPPSVVSTSPAYGATDVPVSSQVSLTFSMPMERATTEAAVSSSPSATWTASWSGGDTVLTLDPTSNLEPRTAYTFTVGTGARSSEGVSMRSAYSFPLTTGAPPDMIAPSVTGTSPPDRQREIDPATSQVSITFSEVMDKAMTLAAVDISPGSVQGSSWSPDGRTLTLTVDLDAGTRYTITVSRSATDLSGNGLEEGYSFFFVTSDDQAEASSPGPAAMASLLAITLAAVLAALSRSKRS